jgi:gamma-glutamyltranspeptidase/glutathione hydrolase
MFRREWQSSAAVYLPRGVPPLPGRLFRNPTLAATYRRVLGEAGDGTRERQIERARAAWYRGFVAEAIDRFCRVEKVMDSSGRRHGGLLTSDDLARWEAPVETPLTFDYRGYTVAKGGPWSQGPVFLQQLALLQGSDLDELVRSVDFVHVVVGALSLRADRELVFATLSVSVPIGRSAAATCARKLVGERAR